MKVQMRTLVCGFIIPALALLFAACGGKQSVASKSAAAYAESESKGAPVGGGHGGHSPAAGEQSTSTGMDHSKMSPGDVAGMDHSEVKSGEMAGMDHSKMKSGDMAGMDHSKMKSGDMAGMDLSKMKSGDMAGMDHSKMKSGDMAGMDQSSMSGMNHGDAIPSGGLWGALPGSLSGAGDAPEPPAMAGMNHQSSKPAPSRSQPSGHEGHSSAAPTSTSAATVTQMARLQPQQTLREDNLDQPAPISVSETLKSSGSGHDMSAMSGEPAAPDAVQYTCPMHPEVISGKPGKCPKCGMNLVKKEKK